MATVRAKYQQLMQSKNPTAEDADALPPEDEHLENWAGESLSPEDTPEDTASHGLLSRYGVSKPNWHNRISPQEKDNVSHSITQTWTDQAIKCYLTEADCANCSIPRGNYSFVCQMNKVVPVLLEQIGEPDAERVRKCLPYLSQY
ncbi:MAG: hypothetical protein SFZ03_02740 [Candidatus Melainabacteria bacterium]|nr:hypothetical protein [Candidatus Melainabacteria bacterium]